jgi:hypothetical protein
LIPLNVPVRVASGWRTGTSAGPTKALTPAGPCDADTTG